MADAAVSLGEVFLSVFSDARMAPPPSTSIEQAKLAQLFCSPPGALRQPGQDEVFFRKSFEALLATRKLSPLELGSASFLFLRSQRGVAEEDPKAIMFRKVQKLCGDAPLLQMHPLRIFYLKSMHLLFAAAKRYRQVEFVPQVVSVSGMRIELEKIHLDDLAQNLALFFFFVENSFKENDEIIFELGEKHFDFLLNNLRRLKDVCPCEEMDRLLEILLCINECLEKKGPLRPLFPVLLQPFVLFDEGTEELRQVGLTWTKFATQVFSQCTDYYSGWFERKLSILKKHGVSKQTIQRLKDDYLKKMEEVKKCAQQTCDGLDVKRITAALDEVRRQPSDRRSVEKLVDALREMDDQTRRLAIAFTTLFTQSHKLVESIDRKIEHISNPFDGLSQLCALHNGIFWYPFQYMLIITKNEMGDSLTYWSKVAETQKALSRTEKPPHSEFVRGYHLILHTLKQQTHQLHSRLLDAGKKDVYEFYSHLVTLEKVFVQWETQKGKKSFKEDEFVLEMFARIEGHLRQVKALKELIKEKTSLQNLDGLELELTKLQNALSISPVALTLAAVNVLMAPQGKSVDLTSETRTFFKEVVEMSLWSLSLWNERPFPVVESSPFFIYLSPSANAYLRGYFDQIADNTAILRRWYVQFHEVFSTADLADPAQLKKVAQWLQKGEELVEVLDIEGLYEEIMQECERYLDQMPEEQRAKAADDFGHFRDVMRVFTDDATTFLTDLYFPNRPLLAYFRYLSLIEEEGPSKDGGAARASPSPLRRSPVVWFPLQEEVRDAESTGGAAAASQAELPISLGESLMRLEGFLFAHQRDENEHVRHLGEYVRCLRGIHSQGATSAFAPYLYVEGITFYTALATEQVLKYLLTMEGVQEEHHVLLSSHRLGELWDALKNKPPLSPRQRAQLADLGHFIVVESRDVWRSATKGAKRIRRVAALSSQGGGAVEQKIEREKQDALHQAEEALAFLCRLLETLPAEAAIVGKGPSFPFPDFRRELDAIDRTTAQRKRDLSLRPVDEQHESHMAFQRLGLEGVKYHLTFLREVFSNGLVSMEGAYPLSMMALAKCTLLLETALKGRIAQVGKGEMLEQVEPFTNRVVKHNHRLLTLYTLLPEPLLSKEEEKVLQTLNEFTYATYRYLATNLDPQSPFKRIAYLTEIYPDAKRGLYSQKARDYLTVRSGAQEGQWCVWIEGEIGRLTTQEVGPLAQAALVVAEKLFRM